MSVEHLIRSVPLITGVKFQLLILQNRVTGIINYVKHVLGFMVAMVSPTLKELEGHIAFRSFVHHSVHPFVPSAVRSSGPHGFLTRKISLFDIRP